MNMPALDRRRLASRIACLAASSLLPGLALANDKPIRLVVPFPAGSATDVLARIIGQQVSASLNVPVVVDNRPGAGGAIGADQVKKAAPDGTTLLLATNTTHAANKSLFKQLSYDPLRDFTPVGKVGNSGMVLMVRPDFPAQSLQEFVAHAKSSGRRLTYGHGSAASQVSAALLLRRIQANATAVAYKGIPNAITDLLGGHIDFVFVDLSNAIGQLQSGKLRGLAVTTPHRAARAPAVPTLRETEEASGMVIAGWFTLMAPAGTPSDAIDRLATALEAALSQPEVREQMAAIGISPDYQPSAAVTKLIETELPRWADWISAAGIVPQ